MNLSSAKFAQRMVKVSNIVWATSFENVSSGICRQRRPSSPCALTPSDQGRHCLLTESFDNTEYTNGAQSPRWYFPNAQHDLNLHILCMSERIFSSPELMLRMSYCDHFSSVRVSVRPCVRPLTFSNDFSSEAPEPILLKFHMEPP